MSILRKKNTTKEQQKTTRQTTISKILYPTDFSELSKAGYEYCLQLAQKLGASIDLVYAYRTDISIPTTASFGLKMAKNKEALVKEQLSYFAKCATANDIEVNCQTIHANPRQGIVNYANENEIDLIMMPTQGENNAVEILFGSTTVAVLTHANCPIWIIPEGAFFNKQINQLAYATDLSQENMDNILLPLEIANAYQAHFNYIYVTSEQEEITKEIINETLITEYEGVQISSYVVENDKIEDGILDFIAEVDINLLVTYSSQKSLLEQLLHLSVTRDIIQKSKTPILVMK